MRTDAHVHILSGKNTQIYEDYFSENHIDSIIGIYDNINDLNRLEHVKSKIYGFFWIHDIKKLPDHVPDGLKFESWIDKIKIKEKYIAPSLNLAVKYGLPILIHCNQLRYDLSRPSYVAEIAKKYKDLTFIIAHSGSYAPPLPDKVAGIDLMEKLVKEAISICEKYGNIFLETSILASRNKRKLIIDNLERIEDRLLLGTDFPLTVNELVCTKLALNEDYAPMINSEENFLVNDGVSKKKLKKIYSNIYKLFK